MALLTATFELSVPQALLIRTSVEDDLSKWHRNLSASDFSFSLLLQGFEVEIQLTQFGGNGVKLLSDEFMVTSCTGARIIVSRDDPEPPPEIITQPSGQIDLTTMQDYLGRRQPDYTQAARTVLERLFSYFRFEKRHPLLARASYLAPQDFLNPTWTGHNGELVWNRRFNFVVVGSIAMQLFGRWGLSPYKKENRSELLSYLQNPPDISLDREFLAESLDAIAESDIRRAVLYMAVACELAIKRNLFSPGSNASQAIEYLEAKRRFRVSVVELLDATGYALGKDFPQYEQIKQLFSCRDRIAHHGKAEFKKDKVFHTPDDQMLSSWWSATCNLLSWLQQ